MRTCYRSKWRLHEDRTILTSGRYYRAADDAPAAPFATYLGSREWVPDKLHQEYGEWGGAQGYDQGVPPRVLPSYSVIGGDCLSRLLPAPAAGSAARQFGRCVELPTQSICGNIPLFTNFSIAYPVDITYYEHVPTYITKDKGEGEWEGKIPDFDATARVRVTESAGVLQWAFALGDQGTPPPPPVHVACCSEEVAGRLYAQHVLVKADDDSWSISLTNIVLDVVFDGFWRWRGYVHCDGTQGTPASYDYYLEFDCVNGPGGYQWYMTVFAGPSSPVVDSNLGVFATTCTPFLAERTLHACTRYADGPCGMVVLTLGVSMSFTVADVPV